MLSPVLEAAAGNRHGTRQWRGPPRRLGRPRIPQAVLAQIESTAGGDGPLLRSAESPRHRMSGLRPRMLCADCKFAKESRQAILRMRLPRNGDMEDGFSHVGG